MGTPVERATDRLEQALGELLLERLPEIAHDLGVSPAGLEAALHDALAAVARQAPSYVRVACMRRMPRVPVDPGSEPER